MRGHRQNVVSLSLLFALFAVAAPTAVQAGELEDATLAEMNFARAHPQDYARRLMEQPLSDWGQALARSGSPPDMAAYAEAVDFLMRQAPLPPLEPDGDLAKAALELVAAQGPTGAVGHSGPGGERFDTRLRRFGAQPGTLAENIAYGPPTPADMVRELIIDSGVPGRGHRRNIFHAGLAVAGVSCGPHRDYATMCVMDFASRPTEVQGWRQAGN